MKCDIFSFPEDISNTRTVHDHNKADDYPLPGTVLWKHVVSVYILGFVEIFTLLRKCVI